MSWYKQYKQAFFIDTVQIADSGKDWITLWIGGYKYEYKDIDPKLIKNIVNISKQTSNDPKDKSMRGGLLSKMIKKLSNYQQERLHPHSK